MVRTALRCLPISHSQKLIGHHFQEGSSSNKVQELSDKLKDLL